MSELPQGVRHILSVYYRATAEEAERGRMWYADARAVAAKLSRTYGCSIRQAAGVLSALSPRVSWHKNVEIAETTIAAWADGDESPPLVQGYTANRQKAWEILHSDADPEGFFSEDTGPKTMAFFQNIVGDPDAVTVDGHAVAIRAGELFPTGDDRAKLWAAKYRRVAADYRAAARVAEVSPAVMQATTWITWHRLHNIIDLGGDKFQG